MCARQPHASTQPRSHTMRCTVINETTGTRCKKTACAGHHICGIHMARSVPHELVQTGEPDTVYRNPAVNQYFGTKRRRIIFDTTREEPSAQVDHTTCKRIFHPWIGQGVMVKYVDNKLYRATIRHIFKDKNDVKWCNVLYKSDGSHQDIKLGAVRKRLGFNGKYCLKITF